MSSFVGEYIGKLDDKGRVKVPAELKRKLQRFSAGGEDLFVLKRGYDGALDCYPMSSWEKELERVQAKVNAYTSDGRMFLRNFLNGIKEVGLDSADRMLIPAFLLSEVGIKGEVVFVAMLDRLELWDPEALRKYRQQLGPEAFAELTAKVMGQP
jgi:MraZ protein